MGEENNSSIDPKELEEIKKKLKEAQELLNKIIDFNASYETAQQSLFQSQSNLTKIADESGESLNKINSLKNESEKYVKEIKDNLEKIQTDISAMEESIRKIENIKGKIEGKEGEVAALVSNINGVRNDIENIKNKSQGRFDKIESLFSQIETKINTMQTEYENFVGIRAKITDENDGLEAILSQSKDLQKKSADVFIEIKSYRDESKIFLDEMKKNQEASETIYNSMEVRLKNISDNQERVEEITNLITDTGFANTFKDREKIIRYFSYLWLLISIIGLIYLFVEIKDLFKEVDFAKPESLSLKYLAYRLTITSPLLFLIGFSIQQYSHERSLNEKYAFKAVIASVMRNHTDFLIEKQENASPENIDFIRNNLQSLYHEPYEKDGKKNKENPSQKRNMSDLVEDFKHFKEIFPEESTLKIVLDFISKWGKNLFQ